MNIGTKTYFVITACKGNNPKADAIYTNELEDILKERGENFTKAEGKYKGKSEEVFLVEAPSHIQSEYSSRELTKSALMELANTFEQESIAEIDVNNNLLYLHYTATGKSECLGRIRVADKEPTGDYTRLGLNYLTLYDS